MIRRLLTPLLVLLAVTVTAPPAHADAIGGGRAARVSAAQASPPVGTFTPERLAGTDTTVVHGVTDGTCDAPGRPDAPVDGFNAVVAGPGAFAPDPAHGRPDGPAIVSTTDSGFSTTQPIAFEFRAPFRDLAQELGTPLLPGAYVVTFRCVNQFDGIIYQTFRTTFTFTGGPPATAYSVTSTFGGVPAGGPAAPPAASAAPEAPAGGGAVPVLLWVALGVVALAVAGALLARSRRSTNAPR